MEGPGGLSTERPPLALVPTDSPALSQRMAALETAMLHRKMRAELRRRARTNPAAGAAELAAIIMDPPTWCRTMELPDLLVMLRGLGRRRVSVLLVRSGLEPGATPQLQDVPVKAARRIAEQLRAWAEEAEAA